MHWTRIVLLTTILAIGCQDNESANHGEPGATGQTAENAPLDSSGQSLVHVAIQDDISVPLQVRQILEDRCYYCHGEDGAVEGA